MYQFPPKHRLKNKSTYSEIHTLRTWLHMRSGLHKKSDFTRSHMASSKANVKWNTLPRTTRDVPSRAGFRTHWMEIKAAPYLEPSALKTFLADHLTDRNSRVSHSGGQGERRPFWQNENYSGDCTGNQGPALLLGSRGQYCQGPALL